MQEVILSKYHGFCPGVRKAVETAYTVYGQGVYILGEIIHNESVVEKIRSLGTTVVSGPDEVKEGTVIIRSHGVGKKTLGEFEDKKIKVINCTCPFVMRTQKIVEERYSLGYQIVITGEKTHPEVVGLNGWCNDSAIVIDEDYRDYDYKSFEKVCLVSQTTYSEEKFKEILKFFEKLDLKTLEVFPTICYTTRERQEEAEILSKTCDAMVVVGGKNSSNTKKLMKICQGNCENVYFISNPDELDLKKIKNFKKVGIVTGASTPDEQSMEVFLKMEENTEVKTEVKSSNAMEEAMTAMDDEQLKFRRGQKVSATISSATEDGLALYINNTKKEILLPKDEIDCENYDKAEYAAKVGEEIEVMIVGLNPVALSQKAIKQQKEEEEAIAKIQNGEIFTVTCTGFNKGGLTGRLGSYEVFVPSSQIRIGYVKELEKYVGKTLRLKSEKIENSGRRKQIVGSQRVILEAEKAEREAAKAAKEEEFFSNIHEGDVVEGMVVRFASFGAFVDVNGFDCLAHISDLSWTNAATPGDVLEIGKKYEFKVLKCDRESKKVSLGYKQLQPKPWQLAGDKYAVGETIKGKVVRIVSFGAFVEVEKGIDGLVHVSQISHEWLENPTSVLKVGDEVEAKIIGMDVENEKMNLSIKALTPAPEGVSRPRREKKAEEENGGEDKQRKPRREKTEDEGPREWNEGGLGGVSLSDLINKD
ncbi:MAG: bifunctional 4-hydroxy-3-methylbut-2-enyl diphosphate reductase/30S ribosomal protein S1 [Candidatus Borkfalkiaceae bacterium]|nr:bifunctional 4-hydroxy-3-methylbut-2-enyl diphosphate reductase/30S ribosomal protein S1 [Christensenellaceae bacterium]